MRAPRFDLVAPAGLDEALEAVREDGARALAGGQSLVQQLAARAVRPRLLVDLRRVEELRGLSNGGAELTVGAMTRQRDLEALPALPVLATAVRHVGHAPTRNRGTIGGSLAFADPTAELPALLLGLGGSVTVRRSGGERRIAADDLFLGPGSTSLAADELLCAVHLPVDRPAAFAQRHFRRRAKVTAVASRDSGGAVRVAVAGLAGTPVLLAEPEPAAAAALAGELPDIHASVTYRVRLAELAVADALSELEA